MALKAKIQTWHDAIKAFDAGDYQSCVDQFTSIPEPCSRLLYNTSCVHLKLGQAEKATDCLTRAVNKDIHFALGFVQRGILHLKSGRMNEAESDFQKAIVLFRGNHLINYRPLGLFLKLYHCEALYNMAVTKLRQGHVTSATKFLRTAQHYQKDLIHEKYLQSAEDLIADKRFGDVRVLELTSGALFRPPKVLTENLPKRTYMDKAKVVAGRDKSDQHAGFDGPERVELLRSGAQEVRPSPVLRRLFRKPRAAPKPLGSPRSPVSPKSGNRMWTSQSMGDVYQSSRDEDLKFKGSIESVDENNQKSLLLFPPPTLLKQRKTSDTTKQGTNNPSHRGSIGSLFGDVLGPMAKGLSLSCNVLTAVVSSSLDVVGDHESTSSEDDVSISGFKKLEPGHVTEICRSCSRSTLKNVGSEIHTRCQSLDGLPCSPSVEIGGPKADGIEDAADEPAADDKPGDDSGNLTPRKGTFTVRKIPPPPSYPPPPLPPNVVIFV